MAPKLNRRQNAKQQLYEHEIEKIIAEHEEFTYRDAERFYNKHFIEFYYKGNEDGEDDEDDEDPAIAAIAANAANAIIAVDPAFAAFRAEVAAFSAEVDASYQKRVVEHNNSLSG